MYTYECTVKAGHRGSGKYLERRFVLKANSILEAMRQAKSLPGVKKGRQKLFGSSILKIAMLP